MSKGHLIVLKYARQSKTLLHFHPLQKKEEKKNFSLILTSHQSEFMPEGSKEMYILLHQWHHQTTSLHQ